MVMSREAQRKVRGDIAKVSHMGSSWLRIDQYKQINQRSVWGELAGNTGIGDHPGMQQHLSRLRRSSPSDVLGQRRLIVGGKGIGPKSLYACRDRRGPLDRHLYRAVKMIVRSGACGQEGGSGLTAQIIQVISHAR